MSQDEKDILLEKFLARELSEVDMTVFEELVRGEESFAREVAMRLAEADAFHRARSADKAEIVRRYRLRRWLRWAVWGSLILVLGIVLFFATKKSHLQSHTIPTFIHEDTLPPNSSGGSATGFSTIFPDLKKSGSSGKDSSEREGTELQALCIRDTSWMRFIPKAPVAGNSVDWESLLAAGKYEEALRTANAFIAKHKDDFADYPYDCLGCGALNVCMPGGDLELAIRCLEVVKTHVDYKSKRKNVATLLVLAHACKNECEKARNLVQEEKIEHLLNDNELKEWLSKCGGLQR